MMLNSHRVRADPTLNPITRRPGPGRGRPRKSQASEAAQPGTSDAAADAVASPTAVPASVPTTLSPTAPTMLPGAMVPGNMPQIPPQLKAEIPEGGDISAQNSNHIDSSHLAESEADSATSQDQLQLDPVQSGDEDTDEHPAKRQRLDPHDLTQDSALDDEAVLALAAHNGTDATDPYPTE
ncbi:hypothetical protein TASIC1_0003047600 [Trichoderma asperellum]|uniref:Uncharacterized protein n=1 Tax=Trichoderma asperellum TaxID=101201 RepID=A0A6V8QSQ7_TRIAP|nr:hypothetical protein TASIC1_0003047600 [Trichoderma asperellum]